MPYQLLVMDDSVTIRRVVELSFAGQDFRVVGVGDGRSALERIEAERPDLVLADVGTLPPDGYEVSAHVKGRADLAHIPVLLLSGAFQPVDEERARACGCDGVLAKPFDPEALVTRVRQLLGAPPEEHEELPSDGDHLIAFIERLLAETGPLPAAPPSPEPEAPAAAPDGRREPESVAPPVRIETCSLDDYFDLVDEALSSPRPSPARGATPRPPRSSPRACSGCRRGSTSS